MRKGAEYTLIGVGAFIVIASIFIAYYKYFTPQQCQLVYLLHSTNFKIVREAIYAVMSTQHATFILDLPDKYFISLDGRYIRIAYEGNCKLPEGTLRSFSYELPFDTNAGSYKGRQICLENRDSTLTLC